MQKLVQRLAIEYSRGDYDTCRGVIDTLLIDSRMPAKRILRFMMANYHLSLRQACDVLENLSWESLEIAGEIVVH